MKLLRSSPAAECVGETSSETVHVAVGRSPEKTRRLLEWTFRRLRCTEIVLVHIHRPSSTIPTLLGNLPADQANEVLVSAHRLEEWKNTQKLIKCYRRICYGSQVQTRVILVESDHIQKGIIGVVNKHAIRILIMGGSPDKCFKVKSMFKQPIYATKTAPFCEMWFVHKGKLVFVREATDSSETIRTTLLQNQSTVPMPDIEWDRSIELERLGDGSLSQFFNAGETSPCKDKCPPKSNPKETSSEASQMREIKLIEDRILATKLEQIELMNQKEEITKELQSATKNLAILDDCVREIIHHQDEATAQFDSIMSSIAELKLENQKIQHERDEYVQQIGRLRRKNHRKIKICNKFIGLGSDSLDLKEFLLSELETATFGFSDKFLIGQVGHGCVYKGEMMNRSVAIKKFHHHSVHGQREFQKEVFVLSKLRHPNLVTPIGACSVASSLVYEFLPNGNLHNRITCKTLSAPLPWINRVQIIAEISCALLFLHSSKPEMIVHGDLKPTNIFLDSNLSCRIGGFGFCELVADQNAARHPLLRQTSIPKNLCEELPYTDPEYQRTGILTSKSDIYSLGMIVLQLLTGRRPQRLVNEVQRAVLSHRLSDLLDITAGEWPKNVSEKLAEFGLKCTEARGCNRPELTPAAVRELELLHPKQERPVPTPFMCPILKEIMYEPVVAMDGFTYEETAIRQWLEDSRDTSPMTNLELENLNLFPNHALKLAIQDWLSQAFQD